MHPEVKSLNLQMKNIVSLSYSQNGGNQQQILSGISKGI